MSAAILSVVVAARRRVDRESGPGEEGRGGRARSRTRKDCEELDVRTRACEGSHVNEAAALKLGYSTAIIHFSHLIKGFYTNWLKKSAPVNNIT